MKRIWIVAGIGAIVLVVGFILSVPHVRDLGATAPKQALTATSPVFVHDAYKKGTHTLTVSFAAPNTCTTVTTTASVVPASSSTPAAILISIAMPADSGICLQGVATTTTTLTAAAAQGVTIAASVNGASSPVVQQ